MTKIACLADLHGHLPPNVPGCDLLLIAGDICPHGTAFSQCFWLDTKFRRWIERLNDRGIRVVGIAGNHDFAMESQPDFIHSLSWRYLQDSGVVTHGLRIWGTPWSPRYGAWAFMKEEAALKDWWLTTLPLDTDILLVHGPPYGYGDFVPYGPNFPSDVGDHVGSPSLLERILEVKPKLVVAGHIHCGHGRYTIGDTIFINASHADEQDRPTHKIEVVEL